MVKANVTPLDTDAGAQDDDLIAVEPKPDLRADFAKIAHREKKQFEQKRQEPPAARTLEQTRAELQELAPVVRGLLHEIELINGNFWANGAEERDGYRAQSPVVVAHFAILALELVEADGMVKA